MSPQKEAPRQKVNDATDKQSQCEKSTSSSQNGTGKPPRPLGSLDRRRQLSMNREERDHKSRSAHSLKEKGSDPRETRHKPKHLISRTGSFEGRHGGGSNSGDSQAPRSTDFHRASPGFWEPPPPPAFPYYWDGYHFWPSTSCHASREDVRGVPDFNMMPPHRRGTPLIAGPIHLPGHDHHPHQHVHNQQAQRYGSNNTLSTSQQDLSCGPYCGRYMAHSNPHMHGYCGCDGGRSHHLHQSTNSLWSQVGKCDCVLLF